MKEIKQAYTGTEPLWSKYFHQKGGRLGLPVSGNFELTPRCNFHCKMCYIHQSNVQGEWTAEDWIHLGKEAARQGMVFLLLTGGEPFLRSDFREIYSGLKRLGLMISINTNASLITDEMIEFLRNDPPLRINVTLYGASEDTYVRLCGVPMFRRVRDRIEKMREAGLSVRLNATITPENACDIEKIYQLGRELGLPVKSTTYLFPPVRREGTGKCACEDPFIRFTAEEAAMQMLRCKEQILSPLQLAAQGIDELNEEDCTDGMGAPMRCRGGNTSFWVTWDGRMLPCGLFPDTGESIEEVGFALAWERVREKCQRLRLPKECASCSLRGSCPACAASCLAENGDTAILPAYICTMTKTLDRMIRTKYPKVKLEENHESQ